MKLTQLLYAASLAGLALAMPKSKRASSFVCMNFQLVYCLPVLINAGFGSNEAGAEFGENNLPGVLGKDYIWPDTSAVQILRDAGMNIFRVPFRMERLIPGGMTGTPDATYMADLKSVCCLFLSVNLTEMPDCGFYYPKRSLCYPRSA